MQFNMNGFGLASAFFACGLIYSNVGFPYNLVDIVLGMSNALLVTVGAVATTTAMQTGKGGAI